jgi:hypothetical protein
MNATIGLLIAVYLLCMAVFKRQTRQVKLETAGDRLAFNLLYLISPLTIPYYVGMRVLRRLDIKCAKVVWADKPEPSAKVMGTGGRQDRDNWKFYHDVQSMSFIDYRKRKVNLDDDVDQGLIISGAYITGLLTLAAIGAVCFGGYHLAPDNLSEIVRNVGETLINVGK